MTRRQSAPASERRSERNQGRRRAGSWASTWRSMNGVAVAHVPHCRVLAVPECAEVVAHDLLRGCRVAGDARRVELARELAAARDLLLGRALRERWPRSARR